MLFFLAVQQCAQVPPADRLVILILAVVAKISSMYQRVAFCCVAATVMLCVWAVPVALLFKC